MFSNKKFSIIDFISKLVQKVLYLHFVKIYDQQLAEEHGREPVYECQR